MFKMSQYEIESKWNAGTVSRVKFNKFVCSAIHLVSHSGWQFKTAGGFDYYFVNSLGYVARHRDGEELKELTSKARVDSKDITTRVEHNVPLDLNHATTKNVHGF